MTNAAPSPSDAALPASTPAQPHEGLAQRLVHLPDRIGDAAIPVLRAGLNHPNPWVRQHAVMGLARFSDARARAALVEALHDDSFGVHWAAAHALAGAGRPGVTAVLRAMIHEAPATGFLHGVAHVLTHAALTPAERATVAPVLDVLRHSTHVLMAPVRAAEALAALEQSEPAPAPGPAATATPWYQLPRRARRRVAGWHAESAP